MSKEQELRPANCRNRLQAEGKPYPRSGCAARSDCKFGNCPYEKAALQRTETPPDVVEALEAAADNLHNAASKLSAAGFDTESAELLDAEYDARAALAAPRTDDAAQPREIWDEVSAAALDASVRPTTQIEAQPRDDVVGLLAECREQLKTAQENIRELFTGGVGVEAKFANRMPSVTQISKTVARIDAALKQPKPACGMCGGKKRIPVTTPSNVPDAGWADCPQCSEQPEPTEGLARHSNKARNVILNTASTDLSKIVSEFDPEHDHLGNKVWDRLDKMACELERLTALTKRDDALEEAAKWFEGQWKEIPNGRIYIGPDAREIPQAIRARKAGPQ